MKRISDRARTCGFCALLGVFTSVLLSESLFAAERFTQDGSVQATVMGVSDDGLWTEWDSTINAVADMQTAGTPVQSWTETTGQMAA